MAQSFQALIAILIGQQLRRPGPFGDLGPGTPIYQSFMPWLMNRIRVPSRPSLSAAPLFELYGPEQKMLKLPLEQARCLNGFRCPRCEGKECTAHSWQAATSAMRAGMLSSFKPPHGRLPSWRQQSYRLTTWFPCLLPRSAKAPDRKNLLN